MQVLSKASILTNVFKTPGFRNIFLVCLAIAIVFPVYSLFFVYPSFTQLLIKNVENDAIRIASHLSRVSIPENIELTEDFFSDHFISRIERHTRDFDLEKLKIFSSSGKILYSTNPKDIGEINKEKYFHDIVAQGHVYTKLVQKNTISLERRLLKSDVVETYVPLTSNDTFNGAFEIYYDITGMKAKLNSLLSRSSAILLGIASSLLLAVVIILFKASQTSIARFQAEESLEKAHGELELRVEERTMELAEANEELRRQITERLSAEKALRKSEEKLAGILNSVLDIIIVVDQDLNIIWSNPVAVKFFGSDPVGKKYDDIFNFRHSSYTSCCVDKCFEDGRSEEHEIEVIGSYGNHLNLWCSASVVARSEDGTPKSVMMVYRDMTEKKLLQAETARAGQLASIGELAAGVAHEINNPINGIINCAQLLIDEHNELSEQAEISMRINKAGRRIAMIVRNLLSFARDYEEEPALVHVKSVLSDSLDLTETQVRKDGIDLSVDIPDELPKIRVRSHKIQQVFLNIISNARYALNQKFPHAHEDKVLRIKGEEVITNNIKYVRVIFYDRGTGIPTDILDRICDPFFTSKPPGKGTGLGLSISHVIVKDHDGRLYFDSVEGEYCKTIVDLPVSVGKNEFENENSNNRG
ncbi:MAG: ATP-binding protein [Candidatus Desulfatibia sp.]|uniref:two-component system sensor histidine kinase NtrB n=1 Tax=Candidatus Desulfatibia sp. TaxID=3101189 RepID=UPI002F31CFB6